MYKLTVKKTPYENEWVARITLNGKLISDYFGDSKEDAENTGNMMLETMNSRIKRYNGSYFE